MYFQYNASGLPSPAKPLLQRLYSIQKIELLILREVLRHLQKLGKYLDALGSLAFVLHLPRAAHKPFLIDAQRLAYGIEHNGLGHCLILLKVKYDAAGYTYRLGERILRVTVFPADEIQPLT